jgi:large subunit ribosomal protein L29
LKVEEIRALSPAELVKQLEIAREELFNLRFKAVTKQLVNHREIPRVKRTIARMKTVQKERELTEGNPEE